MATINITNAKVVRIIENYGFEVMEEKKTYKGDTIKLYYTIWTKDKYEVGDVLEIEGSLSVKAETYTGKDNKPQLKASVSVNDPMIMRANDEGAPF